MSFPEYQKMLQAALPNAEIQIGGAGNKLEVAIVSDRFQGLSAVKRHQLVYKIFAEQIASGLVHALTIKAYTPEEKSAAN